MHKDLDSARDFAEQIRFSGESIRKKVQRSTEQSNLLRNLFFCNELRISKEMTPKLYSSLQTVLARLKISKGSIEAFVYASPEINAQCYSGHDAECVIRFSSALIEILNDDEFQFVAGHELGHFLLSHLLMNASNDEENLEFFMQQRAQEISADRLGLIACESLDIAIKALIKTVSGLSDHHFRFDVGSFLSQLKEVSGTRGQNHQATHPSILVRCRALLWFSMNESYLKKSNYYPVNSLSKLDQRIHGDLEKYVDGSVREKIDEAKTNLSMWMAAYEIVQDGKFSKEEQAKFSETFGDNMLKSLTNFLGGLSANETESTIFTKVEEARSELEMLIPSSFDKELMKLKKWSL